MGNIISNLRVAAAMVSRLTLLSLFTILPCIYGGGYYRYHSSKSVLETLVGDPRFSTLVTAVTTAFPDPGAVLDSVAPLTIFAPTNEVFAAVPADTLSAILADTERLKAILLRHIVPKKVVYVGQGSFTVPEAGGVDLSVKPQVTSSAGAANVIASNIKAKDGVVHAIDALL